LSISHATTLPIEICFTIKKYAWYECLQKSLFGNPEVVAFKIDFENKLLKDI